MSNPFDAGGLGGMMAGFQQQMQAVQARANSTVVMGDAGGGLVRVFATGGLEIQKVEISPKVADDVEMLEDLVVAATNEALRKARQVSEEGMSGILSGLPIPPGLLP
jgi:DNA-binding YbaB/EbfC family protein